MIRFLYDSFTEPSSKLLTLHRGEVGARWFQELWAGLNTAQGIPTVEGATQCLVTPDEFFRACVASASPPTADYDVIARIKLRGTLPTLGVASVIGRAVSGGSNWYEFGYQAPSGGHWSLNRVIAGDAAFLQQVPVSLDGTEHEIMLRMRGDQISGWVDGVQVCLITDTTFGAAGKAGLTLHNWFGGNSVNGVVITAANAPIRAEYESIPLHSAVEDVFLYLTEVGIAGGSTDWDLLRRRDMDSPAANQLVIISEDGGPAPETPATAGIGDSAMRDTLIHVTVRGEPWDSDATQAKAVEIYNALHGQINGFLVGTTSYLRVRAQTPEPLFLGFDTDGRARHTIAFLLLAQA